MFRDRDEIGCSARGSAAFVAATAGNHAQHVRRLAGFGSGASGRSPRRKRMIAGVSTAGAADSISAVVEIVAVREQAMPARSASTGGSDAIAGDAAAAAERRGARLPIASASPCPFGISSKRSRRAAATATDFAVALRARSSTGMPRMIRRPLAPSMSREHGFGGNHIIEARHGSSPL